MRTPLFVGLLALAFALVLLGMLLFLAVPQLSEFASNSPGGSASDYVTGYIVAGTLCLIGAFGLAAFSYFRYSPRR